MWGQLEAILVRSETEFDSLEVVLELRVCEVSDHEQFFLAKRHVFPSLIRRAVQIVDLVPERECLVEAFEELR